MANRALAGLLLLALTALPAAADDEKNKDQDKDKQAPLDQRINAAIDRGAAWLRARQKPDGSWPDREGFSGGCTALSLLALAATGVHADDPVVTKGFAYLEQVPFKKTYVVAVTVLAIEAFFCHRAREKHYSRATHVPPKTSEWMARAVRWLVSQYHKDLHGWRYPEGGTDHSHVQYVLLAFTAACRCGLGHLIPDAMWRECLTALVERQEKTGPLVHLLGEVRRPKKQGSEEVRPLRTTSGGIPARGWAYDPQNPRDPATGSMTSAGIASVMLCRGELLRRRDPRYTRDLDQRAQSATDCGLAWMARHFTVTENPFHPKKEWHYYYLFGIERVGVFLSLEKIGTRDWYREGAVYLLEKQQEEGNWMDEENTAFALLFLKRASVPVITTAGGR